MELFRPLPFVSQFIADLEKQAIKDGHKRLGRIAKAKLMLILTAIILTSRLNLAQISRLSFGLFAEHSLRWLVHRSSILWRKLYRSSVRLILEKYDIKEGCLVVDDTERTRAKSTRKIFGVHKIKNKKSGAYEIAQEFVTCVLVTHSITIPLDFIPYRPDPDIQAWRKRETERKRLNRKLSKTQKLKPEPMPPRQKNFPTKERIAVSCLLRFGYYFSDIRIRSILFDNAYNTPYLVNMCRRRFPNSQIVSKIACNQLVANKSGRYQPVSQYFSGAPTREYTIKVRGTQETVIEIKSARLHVKSLGRWEHVVAVRYKGQKNFRYHSATDLSWRAQDIVFELGIRWLIEVVHEDWKLYEGYGRSATQRKNTGLECGLSLSSLVDTCLLYHPDQIRLAQSGLPLRTVGSLVRKAEAQFLIQTIEAALERGNPRQSLSEISRLLEVIHDSRQSRKHLSGVDFEGVIRGASGKVLRG